MTANEQEEELK